MDENSPEFLRKNAIIAELSEMAEGKDFDVSTIVVRARGLIDELVQLSGQYADVRDIVVRDLARLTLDLEPDHPVFSQTGFRTMREVRAELLKVITGSSLYSTYQADLVEWEMNGADIDAMLDASERSGNDVSDSDPDEEADREFEDAEENSPKSLKNLLRAVNDTMQNAGMAIADTMMILADDADMDLSSMEPDAVLQILEELYEQSVALLSHIPISQYFPSSEGALRTVIIPRLVKQGYLRRDQVAPFREEPEIPDEDDLA